MAYYDAVFVPLECAALHVGGCNFLTMVSNQAVTDPHLFSIGHGCANVNYFDAVCDVLWSAPVESGGGGEVIEGTAVAVLIDGSWRQGVLQAVRGDGVWQTT